MRRVALVIGGLAALASVLTAVPAGGPAAAGPGAEGTADWRTVSAGYDHTCGIRTNGRLYCWGRNQHGQLGTGILVGFEPTPVEVDGGHTDWRSVSAGAFATCGRRADGNLYCWGDDGAGVLGNDAGGSQSTPGVVVGGFTDWTAVSVGFGTACGRRSTGRLYCWGRNERGQAGIGAAGPQLEVPTEVVGGRTDWVQVDVGDDHACGRRANGSLHCWGHDWFGGIGNGAPQGSGVVVPAPARVAGGGVWSTVDVGSNTACARRPNGRLFCWGDDGSFQLGNGEPPRSRSTPGEVAGGRTDWVSVGTALSGGHTCARRAGGRLFCWGSDSAGQVGSGLPFRGNVVEVAAVAGNRRWTTVSAGRAHTCARRSDGRLFCWGSDAYGRLGNGVGGGNRATPSEVAA